MVTHSGAFSALVPVLVAWFAALLPPWFLMLRARLLRCDRGRHPGLRLYRGRRLRSRCRSLLAPLDSLLCALLDAALLTLDQGASLDRRLCLNRRLRLHRLPPGEGCPALRIVLPPERRCGDSPVHREMRPVVIGGRVNDAHLAAVPVEIAEEEAE